MFAYYARCMSIYGTRQEERDIATINKLGYEVIHFPSEESLNDRKKKGENVMETVFKKLVLSSDIVFFRALPDSKISAGVGKEVVWAQEAGLPVLELPTRPQYRTISIEATREYLRGVGQR